MAERFTEYYDGFNAALAMCIEIVKGMSKAEAISALEVALEK